MISRLSEKYSKEMALSLIFIFVIGGMASANILSVGWKVNQQSDKIPARLLFPSPSIEPSVTSKKAVSKSSFSTNFSVEDNASRIAFPEEQQEDSQVIGGPGQPEMSSFKSVGADHMVSTFTGDFSYNIPLLDVGGYPINIFYSSGITMDQEASWVGLGWNINPGTVNRNMRGIPDDFNGTDMIVEKQDMKPDQTWGVTGAAGLKVFGVPFVDHNLKASLGLSYNNKLGVASEAGMNPALTLSMKASDEKTSRLTFGANLQLSSRSGASTSPYISFSRQKQVAETGTDANIGISYTANSRLGLSAMHLNAGVTRSKQTYQEAQNKTQKSIGVLSTHSSYISYLYPTVLPSVRNTYTSQRYTISLGLGGEFTWTNPHFELMGYYSETRISDEDKITAHPAYGYLHFHNADGDENAMLDFNRVNEGVYTPNNPAIALPLYTYDIFSVTGEGTGGSFRAFRSDLGFVRDPKNSTRDKQGSLGLDLGLGNVVHGGADVGLVFSKTEVGGWHVSNGASPLLKFKKNEGAYEAVYFKNPGEKAIVDEAYLAAVGGEHLVRFKMTNVRSSTPFLLPALSKYDRNKNLLGTQEVTGENIMKAGRDKRSQVITFLTAGEASRIGMNKKIYSYAADTSQVLFGSVCRQEGIDSIPRTEDYRKEHHISEINILGSDGRRYVYGLPVYNIEERHVTFSIENGDNSSGLSNYHPGTDDEINLAGRGGNQKGRDGYLKKQTIPAYSHSFLLTELLSADYVDKTGDGISEDDLGDAIKFNYTKFKNYRWRTPTGENKAYYNEGLKTDLLDDKANYIYGEREMWLLYSVESKNMVARFYVRNDRKDGKQVLDSHGGTDASWGMQRLYKINLYSKADLAKDALKARPIRTVQFFHSYKLCKGAPLTTDPGTGKLTLDSLWITHNGNKKPLRYKFYYPKENNPNYDFNGSDRWGGYKPASENPGGLLNHDYPYTIQDKSKTDKYASAWTMNKIQIPSGAVIEVEYESDDYAFVQNRRAANLFRVTGFGRTSRPNFGDRKINWLYDDQGFYDHIYVKLTHPVVGSTASDIHKELKARYFENVQQIYLKLSSVMPSGRNIPGAAGTETISVFADIDDFGMVDSVAGYPSVINAWVKVKTIEKQFTPMVQQALQFLKQQLPFKAYQGYDLSNIPAAKSVVLALGAMLRSGKELALRNEDLLIQEKRCREVDLNTTFVRLSNPVFRKLGGGLRVKRLTVRDSWNKMTGQYEATYGQEYKYVKEETVNGKTIMASSGVASWEPSIGGDENPFREIMRFRDHNRGGPYEYGAVSLPLGEAFYPSPLVGYSRVEVMSIHRDTVKNKPTREVKEFHTSREFPFYSTSTSLSDGEANARYEPRPIMQLLQLDMKKSITQSQGFLVDMNDMNGKEKKISLFSESDPLNPVSYTEYHYNVQKSANETYQFNHKLPSIASAEGRVSSSTIGLDIELMADFREHSTLTNTTNTHLNFDLSVAFLPIPINTILRPVIRESVIYRSAALLKIVNRYGILDSVVVVDHGSMISTRNIVYDAETGNPLLTRTNNEHNRPVYQFTYPAHWAYSGMGPAYKNVGAVFKNLNFTHGQLLNMPSEMQSLLESGDEFYVVAENDKNAIGKSPCDDNPGIDAWTTLKKVEKNRIWALDTKKTGGESSQWIFIDKDGSPYNALQAKARIVRSGRRNLIEASVGRVTLLQNPVDPAGNLNFDETKKITESSATTFRDSWRVDNAFYLVDSAVETKTPVVIRKARLQPEKIMNLLLYYCHGYPVVPVGAYAIPLFDKNYFIANKMLWKGVHSKHFMVGLAKYNFAQLPADAVIISAKMNLLAHNDANDGSRAKSGNINHEIPKLTCNSNGMPTHNNHNPHLKGKDNSFKLTRVIKDWSSVPANYYKWLEYLNQSKNVDKNGVAANPSTPGAFSNKSFTSVSNGKYCEQDLRLDVSLMVQNMFRERDVVPPMLRLELIKNNNYQFDLEQERDTAESRVCFAPPYIDVYYYSCNEPGISNLDNRLCDPIFNQVYCSSTERRLFCQSRFTQKKSINPYVEGLIGNWRMDTSYVYYGERNEGSVADIIDARDAGAIKNFKTFWSFSSERDNYMVKDFAAIDVWIWNSTTTQFNRKGYEIENKDPLGRFTSGLYGYNQHMPVAVANNARVSEILFDGFEDYDYSIGENCLDCKPVKPFRYNTDVMANLDASQSHSGSKSLRLNSWQKISITAPVIDSNSLSGKHSLRIRIDSSRYLDTIVMAKGTGLKGGYLKFNSDCDERYGPFKMFTRLNTACIAAKLDRSSFQFSQVDESIDFKSSARNWPPQFGKKPENFAVRWDGYFQATQTGYYYFNIKADDGVKFWINNRLLIDKWREQSLVSFDAPPVYMVKGKIYPIKIYYFNYKAGSQLSLSYQFTSSSNPIRFVTYHPVPTSWIYPVDKLADTLGSVKVETTWCTRLDSVNVRGLGTNDTLSPLRGSKMLLSAWVKEGGNDCKCSTYINNNITVSYNNGQLTGGTFYPSGNIIEGWQRYEFVFEVPESANSISIHLNSQTSNPVYFDDLRLMPFNATMRSFVYHPSNLRLTTELDENNYATFYEYDDDGTLVRTKKETSEGVKTITESRSAMQKTINENP